MGSKQTQILVATSTSIGNTGTTKVCHEPDGDCDRAELDPDDVDTVEVKCNTPGSYRLVDPTVYPDRRPCSDRRCWEDGVPDVLQK